MNDLIQSPLSIKDIQKQLKSIRLEVEELYLLGKDDRLSEKQGDILKSLKQVEVALEELFCKQLGKHPKNYILYSYPIDPTFVSKITGNELRTNSRIRTGAYIFRSVRSSMVETT